MFDQCLKILLIFGSFRAVARGEDAASTIAGNYNGKLSCPYVLFESASHECYAGEPNCDWDFEPSGTQFWDLTVPSPTGTIQQRSYTFSGNILISWSKHQGNVSVRAISPIFSRVSDYSCITIKLELYKYLKSGIVGLRVYQKPVYIALTDLIAYSDEAKKDYILFEAWGEPGKSTWHMEFPLKHSDSNFQIIVEGIYGKGRNYIQVEYLTLKRRTEFTAYTIPNRQTTSTTISTTTTTTTTDRPMGENGDTITDKVTKSDTRVDSPPASPLSNLWPTTTWPTTKQPTTTQLLPERNVRGEDYDKYTTSTTSREDYDEYITATTSTTSREDYNEYTTTTKSTTSREDYDEYTTPTASTTIREDYNEYTTTTKSTTSREDYDEYTTPTASTTASHEDYDEYTIPTTSTNDGYSTTITSNSRPTATSMTTTTQPILGNYNECYESDPDCEWKNDPSANLSWVLDPSSVGVIQRNSYIFDGLIYRDEPSPRGNSSIRMISPIFRRNSTYSCVTFGFKINIYSKSGLFGLRVYQKPVHIALTDLIAYSDEAKKDHSIFEVWGDHGDYWYTKEYPLKHFDSNFQIILEGIFGKDRMDIKIGYIALKQRTECMGQTTSTTISTTTTMSTTTTE